RMRKSLIMWKVVRRDRSTGARSIPNGRLAGMGRCSLQLNCIKKGGGSAKSGCLKREYKPAKAILKNRGHDIM
ncbi:hypothetical protein AMTR_s03759p00007350, partial [Amborella trichopoda]